MTDNNGTVIKTAYTEQQASDYDAMRFRTQAGEEIHRIEFSKVLDVLLQLPKDATVVEVGCGTGRLLLECTKLGFKVDGADASPYMLEELSNKMKTHDIKVKLEVSESAKLPFTTNKYDFTYAIRLLNQTESKSYALNTIKEMIRVGFTRRNFHGLIKCCCNLRCQINTYILRGARLSALRSFRNSLTLS